MYSNNSVLSRFYLYQYKARYLNKASKAPFYFLINLLVVKLARSTTTQPSYEISSKPKYNFFFSKKTKKNTFLIKKRKPLRFFKFP